MIKEEELSLLNQLVSMLENSFDKFEEAYKKKDSETFNKLKRTIVQTQKKIFEISVKNDRR